MPGCRDATSRARSKPRGRDGRSLSKNNNLVREYTKTAFIRPVWSLFCVCTINRGAGPRFVFPLERRGLASAAAPSEATCTRTRSQGCRYSGRSRPCLYVFKTYRVLGLPWPRPLSPSLSRPDGSVPALKLGAVSRSLKWLI